MVDSTLKLSDAQSDNVKNDIIKAIYSSGTSQKMAADLYAKLYEDLGTALSQNSVSALFGLATDNVDLLMDTFDIDLEKIMMNVGVGTMFSTFQGLIQKGGGPAGDALTAIFYVQKALNYVMQMKQFANNVENRIGWAVFPPVLNNDTTAITSKDGITVESEDGLPSETILQVYKIVDYSHSTNGLDLKENDNYTLYDISLIRNGEETQPKKPVTVYIPIPEGYQQASIMVYRQDQNGEWAFVATMIYNGMIVFEVDHFCLFAIIETYIHDYL